MGVGGRGKIQVNWATGGGMAMAGGTGGGHDGHDHHGDGHGTGGGHSPSSPMPSHHDSPPPSPSGILPNGHLAMAPSVVVGLIVGGGAIGCGLGCLVALIISLMKKGSSTHGTKEVEVMGKPKIESRTATSATAGDVSYPVEPPAAAAVDEKC